MNQHRYEGGRFSDHGKSLGTVTESMIRDRAERIALRNGRNGDQVLESDLAQAYRELTGQERLSPQPDPTETIPNEPRWETNTGSEGARTPAVPASDEQTFAEKLVKEGVADAEEARAKQAEQAIRDAEEKDGV